MSAIPLLAVFLTHNAVLISGLTVAAWLPWLLFGLYSGVIIDRFDRARLLRDVQFFRLGVLGLLTVLVAADRADIVVLYVVTFLVGTAETLVHGSLQALVPVIVPTKDLEKVNGQMLAAEQVSHQFVGPAFGGLLYSLRPVLPFVVDTLSFGLSALLAERLRRGMPDLPAAAARPTGAIRPTGMTRESIEGLRYLIHQPVLRAMAGWVAALNMLFSMAFAVIVLYSVERLRVSGFGYGILISAQGVGGLIGAAISPLLVRRMGRGRIMLYSSVLAAAATLGIGLTTDRLTVGVLLLLDGLSAVSFTVVGRSLRQSLSPDEMNGRITSIYLMLGYGMIPIGALLGGWIAHEYGVQFPFIVGGAGVLVVSLVVGPWLLRGGVDAQTADAQTADAQTVDGSEVDRDAHVETG